MTAENGGTGERPPGMGSVVSLEAFRQKLKALAQSPENDGYRAADPPTWRLVHRVLQRLETIDSAGGLILGVRDVDPAAPKVIGSSNDVRHYLVDRSRYDTGFLTSTSADFEDTALHANLDRFYTAVLVAQHELTAADRVQPSVITSPVMVGRDTLRTSSSAEELELATWRAAAGWSLNEIKLGGGETRDGLATYLHTTLASDVLYRRSTAELYSLGGRTPPRDALEPPPLRQIGICNPLTKFELRGATLPPPSKTPD